MIEFSILVAALALFCIRITNHNTIINEVDIEYKIEELDKNISKIADVGKSSPLLVLLLYLLACIITQMIPVLICVESIFVFSLLSVTVTSFIKIFLCVVNSVYVFASIQKGKMIDIHRSNIMLLRIGYVYDIFYYSFIAVIALFELLKLW